MLQCLTQTLRLVRKGPLDTGSKINAPLKVKHKHGNKQRHPRGSVILGTPTQASVDIIEINKEIAQNKKYRSFHRKRMRHIEVLRKLQDAHMTLQAKQS